MESSACDIVIEYNIPFKGVASVTLNKPDVHNAFDEKIIASFISILREIKNRSDIRVVCLQATGKSFCAGADLNWMKRMSSFSEQENIQDASQLSELMFRLANLPQPTIAMVQGNAFGGGVGLIACCDIVIANDQAQYCLSEVKLGLIPAVISPYIVTAIGMRSAKYYMLTAEVISPHTALQLGLIHKIVEMENLNTVRDEKIKELLANGPAALREVKNCCYEIANSTDEKALQQKLIKKIAYIRASEESKEGMQAFFAKRKPRWNNHD